MHSMASHFLSVPKHAAEQLTSDLGGDRIGRQRPQRGQDGALHAAGALLPVGVIRSARACGHHGRML